VFDEISADAHSRCVRPAGDVKLATTRWVGIINVVVIELGMISAIGVIVFLLHGLAREIPIARSTAA